jgi:hypothetical protein
MIETLLVCAACLAGGCGLVYLFALVMAATDSPSKAHVFRYSETKMSDKTVTNRKFNDDYSYDDLHLPVTPEKVRAVLAHPDVTYEACEKMYWSVTNHPDYGWTHPLLEEISQVRARLVREGK